MSEFESDLAEVRNALIAGAFDGTGRTEELWRLTEAAFASTKDRLQSTPADLRAKGFRVVAHNDYHVERGFRTYWAITTRHGGECFIGEGGSDEEALDIIRKKINGWLGLNCDPEVFASGELVLTIAGAGSALIEQYVHVLAEVSEAKVDWHYAGGIAHVLATGDVAKVKKIAIGMRSLLPSQAQFCPA